MIKSLQENRKVEMSAEIGRRVVFWPTRREIFEIGRCPLVLLADS